MWARFGALFPGEYSNLFALLVQGFRSNIRPVGPSDGASFDSCPPKEVAIPEWRKNGSTLQVLREVNDSTGAVIKNDQERIVCFVLNMFDVVEIPHGSPQSNGSIFLISFPAWARSQSSINFADVQVNPFTHEFDGGSRFQISLCHVSG